MKRLLFIIAFLATFAGCRSGKNLLPNVSGKAGEVVIVAEKSWWDGELGEEVRGLLGDECPYLAQQEPLYNLVQVTPGGFTEMFKVHRNIVSFNINPAVDTSAVLFRRNVWAAPQCVIQICAKSIEQAASLFADEGSKIAGALEQAERDRVIANCIRYEEKEVSTKVSEVFGSTLRFPVGYKIKKLSHDFVWVADEKQYTNQGIFMYRYATGDDKEPFTVEKMVEKRNEILALNVPGMFDGTYMTTSDFFPPILEYIRYKGRDFAELRAYWEVRNDFMGGPFASHSFYSADGSEIIVLEAFVYAPKFDKRQYLRQVESILWSWEDAPEKEAEE